MTGILGLSFLVLLKHYGWCALLRCSSDTRSVCLPHFSCGTYMAGVPFCFVSARCVYISSASTFAYSGYGQVFFNSVVATATSKITACHIRSLKAWYKPGQFSKFHNIVPEMTNYCEMLFFVLLFFVHITSMPVMDLHTCRTLNTVPEQCVPFVIICSIAWPGHWYLLHLFSNTVSTAILCAVFSDEKDVDARSIWLTISCLSSGSLINDDISLLISDSAMDLDVSFPETKIH